MNMNTSTTASNQTVDAMGIGRRILLSRRDLKINQEELGEKSGVSRGHIAKIERGEVINPTIDVIYRLADALGVSRAYLLGFTDDPLHEINDESEKIDLQPLVRPQTHYRTLGAELLDIFDQLSPDSQQIILAIADKLRSADAPGNSQKSEGSD